MLSEFVGLCKGINEGKWFQTQNKSIGRKGVVETMHFNDFQN